MGDENKEVACDDINSGGAVMLWPMEERGRRVQEVDTRNKGRQGH